MGVSVPGLPAELMQEAVPGNIRRAEHFLQFMKKVRIYAQTHPPTHSLIHSAPLTHSLTHQLSFPHG